MQRTAGLGIRLDDSYQLCSKSFIFSTFLNVGQPARLWARTSDVVTAMGPDHHDAASSIL
jgi:hypothetical protein